MEKTGFVVAISFVAALRLRAAATRAQCAEREEARCAAMRLKEGELRVTQRKSKPTGIRVSALYHYPVKSCAGVQVDELSFDEFGFEHDRRWAIVQDGDLNSKGQKKEDDLHALAVVTTRKYPLMALIQPSVSGDIAPTLTLKSPGMPPLVVNNDGDQGSLLEVELWTVCGQGRDCGDAAAAWVHEAMKAPASANVRLVYFGKEMKPRDPRIESTWNGGLGADHSVYPTGTKLGFSDSTDCTLMSGSSLADLNSRIGASSGHAREMAVQRFRMNVIVEGCSFAYEEDLWKKVQIGQHGLTSARLCNRCSVTLVDPATGKAKVGEPLKTLRKYRLYSHLWASDARHGNGPLLGVKLCFGEKQKQAGGSLKVGDMLSILDYRDEYDRFY